MGRAKNPRRELLAMLKPTRDRLYWIHDNWTWMGRRTVYTAKGFRTREAEEYPENQVGKWREAYLQVQQAIRELEELQRFIAKRHDELEGRGD